MTYAYIALCDPTGNAHLDANSGLDGDAARLGLAIRYIGSGLTVYASPETPTLSIPGRGVLIGHLFKRDGKPFTSSDSLPSDVDAGALCGHLAQSFWGEYILLHAPETGDGRVTAMRDPSPSAGAPCLYSLDGGRGFLTSHISLARSLGLIDTRIDWDFIAHNLQHPHVKNGQTGFVGVRELLPGCAIDISAHGGTLGLVWQPWRYAQPESRHHDRRQAADDVRHAITTAVRSWAGVDESILLELSGGLDSSIVGISLQGASADVTCCTLVPPVPGADERRYAQQIANALGVELQAEALSFEAAVFDFDATWQPAVPRIGLLQYAVNEAMVAAGRRHRVRSHFSGGGGDTTLCYLQTAAPVVDAYLERGLKSAATAIRNLADLHQTTLWTVARLALRKWRRAPRAAYTADRSFVSAHVRSDDYPAHPWTEVPADTLPGDRERIVELAGCQVFRDAVPRDGLPFRMPLLSQPVVEACLKTPTWMWIEGGINRAVARSAFSDLLPPDIRNRRSKGTYMNYLGAIYRESRWKMHDYLLSGHLHSRGLLDDAALCAFIARDLPPRDRSFTRIFELCMIENWVRHHA